MKEIFFLIKLIRLTIFINHFFLNLNDLLDLNINVEEDKGEIRRNLFFLKFIISISLVIWFKMDKEQVCGIIISNILSELIENLASDKPSVEVEVSDENLVEENSKKEEKK